MNYYTTAETPLGELIIAEEEDRITRLFLSQEDWVDWKETVQNTEHKETPNLAEAKQQLQEYFAGERKTFSLPLSQKGTPFQQKVWQALERIPYGESRAMRILPLLSAVRKRCALSGRLINVTTCRFLSRATE